MRLTCPNCGAQYEVPPEAIPPGGREVQCSACGQGWFEQPAESKPQLIDPEPWDLLRVEGDEEEADDLAEAEAAPPPPPAGAEPPARPRVPPEVERILREEAQREARARAEESSRPGPVETPPSPPAPPWSTPPDPTPPIGPPEIERTVVRRLAPRDLPSSAPAPDDPPPLRRARGERPLDLDRINSTLRSQADEIGTKAPQLETGRRRRTLGFFGGFWTTLVILGLLAGLYLFRPQIVDAAPQLARVLDPYARVVDSGRFWLDREIGRLLGVGAVSN